MFRGRGSGRAFTMVELLVVIAIIALLAAFLLPVIAQATASARRANCSNKQRQIYQGVRMYLNNFEEYFPPAWVIHKPQSSDPGTDARLGYLSTHRLLIQEYCEAGFSHLIEPDKGEVVRDKVLRNRGFWTDPGKGYTTEYFSPRIFNGLVDTDGSVDLETEVPAAGKFDSHIAYTQAIQAVPATQLPILTEVDVGYPAQDPTDWKEKVNNDETHKTMMKNGWQVADVPGGVAGTDTIHVGIGRATRDKEGQSDVNKKYYFRYDFRHNKSLNVLFLDSHIEVITETNATRIDAITEAWNSLTPPGT